MLLRRRAKNLIFIENKGYLSLVFPFSCALLVRLPPIQQMGFCADRWVIVLFPDSLTRLASGGSSYSRLMNASSQLYLTL
jgi:hypothetical protein